MSRADAGARHPADGPQRGSRPGEDDQAVSNAGRGRERHPLHHALAGAQLRRLEAFLVRQPRHPPGPILDRASGRIDRRHDGARLSSDAARRAQHCDDRHRARGAWTGNRKGAEIRSDEPGHRAGFQQGAHEQRRRYRAHASHQHRNGLPTCTADDRAASRPDRVSEEPYGVRALPELYKEWATTGMVANIGTRIVEVGYGRLVLEGNMTADRHGFPTSHGTVVHGGAIATLADEALASVAFTVAEEGETTVTADLKVDYLRPAKPGRLIARATVRHRTRRLAFCEATVEHAHGQIVAEARAVIAYVKA